MIVNKVKIENSEFNYDLNNNVAILDNENYEIEILKRYANDFYEILVNNKKVLIGFKKENNQIQLNYNNRQIDVEMIDSFTALKKEMTKMSGASSTRTVVKAPMPGLVIKIFKNLGDSVQKGETVMIIEAMKMENAIKSPVNGNITAIKVESANSVAKNDVLFEIQ